MSTNSFQSFQAQCLFDQSIRRYVSDLYLAKSAGIQASSGVSSSSDLVNVVLGSVSYYDPYLGTTTDVTSTYASNGCSTLFIPDISLDSGFQSADYPCVFASTDALNSILNASSTTPVSLCSGVIQRVSYNVNHTASAAGTLDYAVANVVITDIGSSTGENSAEVIFEQQFEVSFFSADTSSASQTNGNIVRR